MHTRFVAAAVVVVTTAGVVAQSPAREQLARGNALWDQRLANRAIAARAKAQADPAPYFTGAQILIDRGEYDRAMAMAQRGVTVSDRFIDENLSAYQMTGKSQGSYARGRGTAADLIGWALFLKKD